MEEARVYSARAKEYILMANKCSLIGDKESEKKYCIKIAECFLNASNASKDLSTKEFCTSLYEQWIQRAWELQEELIKHCRNPELSEVNINFEPLKVTGTTFDDVAGLEEVKNFIKTKIIKPIKYPEDAEKFGINLKGGIILYGPPGTGKTLIAKAIANETNLPFYAIKASDIMHWWVGKSEKLIEKLFEKARKNAPSIIYVDEMDALLHKRRSTNSSVMPRIISQFLTELDGIKTDKNSTKNVFFIGSTNEPWALDNALRSGRITIKIFIPPPDFDARKKIFMLKLKGYPVEENIDYDKLAKLTEGYVGADIEVICELARMKAFDEYTNGDKNRRVRMDDLFSAISLVPPSVTKELMEKYEEYKNSIGEKEGEDK